MKGSLCSHSRFCEVHSFIFTLPIVFSYNRNPFVEAWKEKWFFGCLKKAEFGSFSSRVLFRPGRNYSFLGFGIVELFVRVFSGLKFFLDG